MAPHHFLVGTFSTPVVFTLAFDDADGSLRVAGQSKATGAHSWLSLNADLTRLYATAWTTPPGLASYRVVRNETHVPVLEHINSVETKARSGYCCNSSIAVYSAGGPTGEVFKIDPETGGFDSSTKRPLQALNFVDAKGQQDDGGVMDFGGLRHGAHSADLSLDGKRLYIADIGRNCIFVYSVQDDGKLVLTDKNIAPRPTDGPRHVTPHPNGHCVYSLQEHTSMVDVFEVSATKWNIHPYTHALLTPFIDTSVQVSDQEKLDWKDGVKIIPKDLSPTLFWADEVRLSPSNSSSTPSYLYASTRGLEPSTLGYVAVFKLLPSGLFASPEPLAMLQTPTSGGWANAIEPAPWASTSEGAEGKDYLALTDSEEGLVMVLSWNGEELKEVARVQLDGKAPAATAVWID
ncbi:BQ5605_C008g05276 [Microbotryum silenes-dioicae]|uniref:BQ5605_C008g05276 protein n=1 Tax=Microbotryum silenes-dioicae TaxID=796604 RepID=A0A2X0MCJ3_9BASI|nr:BQ5605_C008g05276 [Microbotryum silenes-dioicae]